MSQTHLATGKIAALIGALFLAYLFRGALVQPPAVDTSHVFNTERAFERLTRILGDETPHPVDSDANDRVRERLITEIEALGFKPMIRDKFHCVPRRTSLRCARLQNIAFWVTPPGPNAVLVLSHYDSVPAGPGASDDGAGVASSLEIAAIMRERSLSRPLLVLITDGEELALMGANMFVVKDPLAANVGAVVNMEARGVRGLSSLIQTGRPNGRDLKTLVSQTRLPAASSLNADIYELLPNDTDMTELLSLNIDAANLAYAGGVRFYHTPHDTLANMDKRALFNLGASGLAATEVFLAQTGAEPEQHLLYVGILGLFVLKLPVAFGAALLGLGVLTAGAALWQARAEAKLIRVALVPPLALTVGLALAIGASVLVGAIRPEVFFGSAWPIALRGVHASAALLGALFIYTFMTRAGENRTLLAVAWLWFALIGALVFALLPGAAVIFIPSALIFALAAGAAFTGRDGLAQAITIVGALVFAAITLPLTALGETGLLIEGSAPFVIAILFLLITTLPLVLPRGARLLHTLWQTLIGTGTTLVAFMIASLLVPAYSAGAPRGLSVSHIQGGGLEQAVWSVSGTHDVPAAMNAVAPFSEGTLPDLRGTRQLATAPPFETQGARTQIMSDTIRDGARSLTLAISAPETDRLIFLFSGETALTSIALNGETVEADDRELRSITCAGRACRSSLLTLQFDASAPAPDLNLLVSRFGLGSESEALLAARPASATAVQTGDQRITMIPVNLGITDAD